MVAWGFYKYVLDSHLLSENEFKILKQLYHYVLLQNEKKGVNIEEKKPNAKR